MSNNIMSSKEYLELMEDIGSDTKNPMAPDPSSVFMTNTTKSPETSTALSGIDGNGGGDSKPREEKNKHKGGEGTSMADMNGGGDSKPREEKNRPKGVDVKVADGSIHEELTLEDADIENIDDADDDFDADVTDMSTGNDDEITTTKDFLLDLLQGVAQSNLDDTAIATIVDCVAESAVGKTLGVDDIAEVMSNMKAKVEDVAAGDGKVAGPEGGDEYSGETQLMGDMDECSACDKNMDEKADDEASEKGGPDEKEQLDEAWLTAIPNVGNPKEKLDVTDMSDDDIEFAEMRRLAGM